MAKERVLVRVARASRVWCEKPRCHERRGDDHTYEAHIKWADGTISHWCMSCFCSWIYLNGCAVNIIIDQDPPQLDPKN